MSYDRFVPNFMRQTVDRRTFLRGVTGTALGAFLAGCSGGDSFVGMGGSTAGGGASGGGSTEPLFGVPLSGTVNLAELGGGSLVVMSAQQAQAPVGADGSFTTTVTGVLPQLLMLTEPSASRVQGRAGDILRGVALHLPGAVLAFTAESVASSLLFLTYGIMTMDPVQAAATLSALQALSSYPAYRDQVRAKLLEAAFLDLLADPQVQALRDAVVEEYLATLSSESLDHPSFVIARQLPAFDGQGIPQDGASLENRGLRFVSVIRHEVDADGNEIVAPRIPELKNGWLNGFFSPSVVSGVVPFSPGNWWTGQVGQPGTATETFIPSPVADSVNYWTFGVGRDFGEVTDLPSSIDVRRDVGHWPFTLTTFFFLFLPLLDVVSGTLGSVAFYKLLNNEVDDSELVEALGTLGTHLGVVNSSLAVLDAGLTPGGSLKAPLLDATVFMVGTLASAGAAFVRTWASRAVAQGATSGLLVTDVALAASFALALEFLAVALGAVGAVFGLLNLGAASLQYSQFPAIDKVKMLRDTIDFDVVQPPLGGSFKKPTFVADDEILVYMTSVLVPDASTALFRVQAMDGAGERVLLRQQGGDNSRRALFLNGASRTHVLLQNLDLSGPDDHHLELVTREQEPQVLPMPDPPGIFPSFGWVSRQLDLGPSQVAGLFRPSELSASFTRVFVYDISTGSYTDFSLEDLAPGNYQDGWSVRLSPDGSKIAGILRLLDGRNFLFRKSGAGPAELGPQVQTINQTSSTTPQMAVNDAGETAFIGPDGKLKVFDGSETVVDFPVDPPAGYRIEEIWDMNNRGDVVGTLESEENMLEAVLWTNGQVKRLAPLLAETHTLATSVSDDGWIAGFEETFNGRAFLLKPRLT